MRFATHKDFVRKHMDWTFSLRTMVRPMVIGIIALYTSAYVCTAQRGDVKLVVISDTGVDAWMELMTQVERSEANG